MVLFIILTKYFNFIFITMRQIILFSALFYIVFIPQNIRAQIGGILTVPTDSTFRQDSSYWGGAMPYLISQWQLSGWIERDEVNCTSEITAFSITNFFNPSNTDLNLLVAKGGDITNWTFYFRTSVDFLTDTISRLYGGNTQKISAYNNIEQKTVGEYFDESSEIYYNTYTSQYIISALTDSGIPLSLSKIIQLRNAYNDPTTKIYGYLTMQGLATINPANLIHRSEW